VNRRRAARFGAVQALYQLELSGAPVEQVVAEFVAHRLSDLLGPLELADAPPRVDRTWFEVVTTGAWRHAAELDALIEGLLAPGWTLNRLGFLLRAFLRAGAFELVHRPDVPARAVVSEYVELAHAFLSEEDGGFVNAVLDRLARRLRPAPGAPPGAPEPGPAGG
jgi:transcription antitermination protein NusB